MKESKLLLGAHVLINQHLFFLLNATAKNFDKIPMLKFCNQQNFIFECFYSLS